VSLQFHDIIAMKVTCRMADSREWMMVNDDAGVWMSSTEGDDEDDRDVIMD
jgi:hypothetical protein